jgi:hypothetical protein
MKRPARLIACLAAAGLAASCTVYKFREMDGKSLAAKGRRGRILSVQTATETFTFSEKDPVEVKNGAVLGSLRVVYTLDPVEISAVIPARPRPRIVLDDGSRFQVAASRPVENRIRCETIQPVAVPLDEVVKAKVRVTNTGASILSTLGGAVLVIGAVALDVATYDDVNDEPGTTFTEGLMSGIIDDLAAAPGGSGLRKSNRELLGMAATPNAAGEIEFWTREWATVEARPGDDGKLCLRLENASNAPLGIDEAKLIVIDHDPGLAVAPDIRGGVRALPAPVPPDEAVDSSGKDIRELIAAKDDILWRSPMGVSAPVLGAGARDRLTFSFPRPKAVRRAKLIISAATSSWPADWAREAQSPAAQLPIGKSSENPAPKGSAGGKPALTYQPWEYRGLRVELETFSGWQTAQVIFAPGPLPDFDLIYDLDLSDVIGDKVRIKLGPPAGYWLVDRLALDFGPEVALEPVEIAAETVAGEDGSEVLAAIASEDSRTLRLAPGDPPALATFRLPPPREGLTRTVFLRKVNCYEMPGGEEKRDGSKEERP